MKRKVDTRIEALETKLKVGQRGLLIVMCYRGEPEPTKEEIDVEFEQLKRSHHEYKEGDNVVLDFMHGPDGQYRNPRNHHIF